MTYDLQHRSPAEERAIGNILHGFQSGYRAHAYILEGGSAASRMRCALYLASALVCGEPQNGRPCLNCRGCRAVIDGEHDDVKIIVPEDGKDIKVDAVRELRKDAYVLPTQCDYHVYIAAECQKMNAYAQNALLKLLEEPPENTVFFLLAPTKELLLPTVVSRAQAHHLGIASLQEEIADFDTRFAAFDAETRKEAAKLQRFTDKTELSETALRVYPKAKEILSQYYIEKNTRLNEALPTNEAELSFTLCLLAAAARDIAVRKRDKDAELFVFSENDPNFQKAFGGMSLKRALELYDAFTEAADSVREYGNRNAVLTVLYTKIR